MIKTLLIAPYSGLVETAKKIATPDHIQLDIVIGNLDEGVEIARSAEKEGYQLIISRGGTATMIQAAVSIPVIHIDITGYDVLRVLTLIQGMKEGVALVGYPNISEGANTICNILEYNVKRITIKSRDEVRGYLEQLKKDGYEVVIGDVITVQVAEQVGLRGVLITSGKEALMDAFEEGKRVYNFFRKVNHQFDYIRNAFNQIPMPLAMLDKYGKVIKKNKQFEEQVSDENILQSQSMSLMIDKVLNHKGAQWMEVSSQNKKYEIQSFMASEQDEIIGLIIHSVSKNEQTESVITYNQVQHMPIIGKSNYANRLRKLISKYIQMEEPICIIGEPGTGKESIGKEIHFQRFGYDAPLVMIDVKAINSLDIKQLQEKLNRIRTGSLLIKNIDEIPDSEGQALFQMIDNLTDIKVIVLANNTFEKSFGQGGINQRLYRKLTHNPVHIPPLRERKEDISSFIDYFIAEFHALEGNDILGMKPDAVECMRQYDWPGNLSQLKTMIRELTLTVDGNYIELLHVKELLNQYIKQENENHKGAAISLSGTLKEMEQQIIKQVLEEEDNNQSRAASRLGINRSTLWRKLKT